MEFRLAFTPKPLPVQINHQQALFLIGSCFTENIGTKLKQVKFSVLENPHGILFNPISIAHAIQAYINNKMYQETDLVYHNESWHSWHHHSRFSHPDKAICLAEINKSQQTAHQFLQTANWIFITLGSAFVYEKVDSPYNEDNWPQVVANCHKIPTDKFNRRLLNITQATDCLQKTITAIQSFNPSANIIFTISPVRHLREGFIENNRSKAILNLAVHQVVDNAKNCFYFPAYELVIDDLRDYRFFAEDMVHPNYAATNYVWEKFVQASIDESTQQLMKEIQVIVAAKNHKAFNPTSNAHKKFLQTNLDKVHQLQQQFPQLNFEEELAFFNQQ